MKPLKLKCVLYSDDGKTWRCIRQFYVTDVISQNLLDQSFAGMVLERVDKLEENNDNKSTSGQQV